MGSREYFEGDSFEQHANPASDLDEQAVVVDSLRAYFNRISKIELLSAEDEIELSKQFEAGAYAQHLIEAAEDEAHPDREKWDGMDDKYRDIEFLQHAALEGNQAKRRLIESNLRLAVSVAKRYKDRGVPLLDLIQDANLGLMRAVDGFDYAKGHRFSSYAVWCIRQSIERRISDYMRIIHLPENVEEKVGKIVRAQNEIYSLTGKRPTLQQIAEHADIGVAEVKSLEPYSKPIVSLDRKVGEKEDGTIADFLAGNDDMSGEQRVEQKMLYDELRIAIVKALKTEYGDVPAVERRRGILWQYYGLDNDQVQTYRTVAASQGMTYGNVKQNIERSLEILENDTTVRELEEIIGR